LRLAVALRIAIFREPDADMSSFDIVSVFDVTSSKE
jgi:hypothetical protein